MNELKNEEILKEKARSLSMKGGALSSVSDGFGAKNITPYALALGAGNNAIGFLNSVPSLIGNFFQLITFKLMKKHSRKKINAIAVSLQAFMWLLILIPGILFFEFGVKSDSNLILLVSIYAILTLFGAIYAPAWSSWMRDITDDKSGSYFGRRSKVCGFITLFSMLIAGFLLDYFKQTKIFIAFIILFSFSFFFRLISVFVSSRKYEPFFKADDGDYFSFSEFLKKMKYNNFGRFVLFISLISLGTAIASPFFAVYMLKDLHFSYSIYMAITIISILTGLLSMPFWGRFGDNYGNMRIMKVLGFFIPFIPILWIFSIFIKSYWILVGYLFIIEAFSGFICGGFNLASSNFVFNAVSRERTAICFSYFNILNGIGVFIGATMGGLISSIPGTLFSLSFILITFLVSGIFRLIIQLFMFSKIDEVKEVSDFHVRDISYTLKKFSPARWFNNF